jgi:hypothetical protein
MARDRKPYEALMADRPEKFDPEDVNYREADSRQRCWNCLHFYMRRIDEFGVCEIMRPQDDGSVEPDYVCDYFTKDGETFPLLP